MLGLEKLEKEPSYWRLSEGDAKELAYELGQGLGLGERLGSGCSRVVFELLADGRPTDYVLKVGSDGVKGANAREWLNWQTANEWSWSSRRYLCPVRYITSSGNALVMRRVDVVATINLTPSKVPAWFADVHAGNFGILTDENGVKRVVCIDYAITRPSVDETLVNTGYYGASIEELNPEIPAAVLKAKPGAIVGCSCVFCVEVVK